MGEVTEWDINEQEEFLSLLPVQPMLGLPLMNKPMRLSSECNFIPSMLEHPSSSMENKASERKEYKKSAHTTAWLFSSSQCVCDS